MTLSPEAWCRREAEAPDHGGEPRTAAGAGFASFLIRRFITEHSSTTTLSGLGSWRSEIVLVLGAGPSAGEISSDRVLSIGAAPGRGPANASGFDFAVVSAPGQIHFSAGSIAVIDPLRLPPMSDLRSFRRILLASFPDGTPLPSRGINALLAVQLAACLGPRVILCAGFDGALADPADATLNIFRNGIRSLIDALGVDCRFVRPARVSLCEAAAGLPVVSPEEARRMIDAAPQAVRDHGSPPSAADSAPRWSDAVCEHLRSEEKNIDPARLEKIREGEARALAWLRRVECA